MAQTLIEAHVHVVKVGDKDIKEHCNYIANTCIYYYKKSHKGKKSV